MSDPIDTAADLLTRFNIDVSIRQTIITELRRQWGGAQVYIRARDPSRDEVIRQGLQAGEKPEAIARRAGVLVRTVRRRASRWF